MSSITYISIFAKDIDNYIQFKCSMGYSKSTYDNALKRFDRFCAENFPDANSITEDIAIAWSEKRNNESENSRIRRMITLKGFTDYLAATGIETYVFPKGFIGQYRLFHPYLYGQDELARFFRGADTLPVHPVAKNRELIAPVIFRMHLCCGLRPQETLALKRDDVNLANSSIYIADTKVHKDRVVAMSPDLCRLCELYEDKISSRIPERKFYFQRTQEDVPLTALWQERLFAVCAQNAGLHFQKGNKPCVYSFRHNFATLVIKKWFAEGKDIASMLPVLSGYMGHTSLEDTAYYIHLVPEHLTNTGLISWNCIPEVPAYED